MVFFSLRRHSSHSKVSDDLKPDISEEELKKLYAKASAQRFDENPRYPFHPSGGVTPMEIKGRFVNERERLGPDFDDVQRQWRVKWIKDQTIHPSEPFEVKQLYIEYYNPLRRFYRKPLDVFERYLRQHYMTPEGAKTTRMLIGRGFLLYLGVVSFWYYLQYNREHWENYKGMRVIVQRDPIVPGDVRWPHQRSDGRTESWQHFDRGFHDRKVLLNKDSQ